MATVGVKGLITFSKEQRLPASRVSLNPIWNSLTL